MSLSAIYVLFSNKSRLADRTLKNCLQLATTNIIIDLKVIALEKPQTQKTHKTFVINFINCSNVNAVVSISSVCVNCFIYHFEQLVQKVDKLVAKWSTDQNWLDHPVP